MKLARSADKRLRIRSINMFREPKPRVESECPRLDSAESTGAIW
jgi:hypothetical protein